MSGNHTSDIDRLFDRLVAGIKLLREQDGESLMLDDFEARLFEAHDAVMTDYALVRLAGGLILSNGESIDQFNLIRSDILLALQNLYRRLQLDILVMKKQMRDNEKRNSENAGNDD